MRHSGIQIDTTKQDGRVMLFGLLFGFLALAVIALSSALL